MATDIQAHLREFKVQNDEWSLRKQNTGPIVDFPSISETNLLNHLQMNYRSSKIIFSNQEDSFNVTYPRPPLPEPKPDSNSPRIENYCFEVKVLYIVWDEQPALVLVLHDVTQQQTILSYKLADAYKDNLLATISHELRTPLNGILGMLQIMQKYVKDASILNYIDICKNSGQLLLGLVNSILDLNQIQGEEAEDIPGKG